PPQGGRLAEISGPAAFMARLERSLAIRGFLAAHGWGDANRLFLFGDASMRAYETATLAGETRVVMNSPRQPDGPPVRDGKPYNQIAHLAESVTPFVAVGRALKAQGFSAPVIHAADLDAGILMVEHLGGEGILDPERRPIPERYHASVNLLAELHQHRWPKALPVEGAGEHIVADYDRGAMQIEVALLTDWYLPGMTGRPASDAARESFVALWDRLIDRLASAEKTLVLRDYHSPNILWRDDRGGLDRIGLIDFQDAMIGPAAYDVASLAQDARATVPAALEHELVERYVAARGGGFDRDAFLEEYAILAAQRATKILGIFVRLNLRDGKPGYLQHLPRMQAYLARCLAHPVLAEYKAWCEEAGLLQGLEAA
ncbi:MAG TPA: phosphotransferase, partial [Rhizobiaceae bacterium]|nr:phosphotransferase [Rhizobiaceae bacterium]